MFTNFGRDVVFSADLCYNKTNEKPRPLGEVAAKPTERANGGNDAPSHPTPSGALPRGEPLGARNLRGVWALHYAFVIQRRNWR